MTGADLALTAPRVRGSGGIIRWPSARDTRPRCIECDDPMMPNRRLQHCNRCLLQARRRREAEARRLAAAVDLALVAAPTPTPQRPRGVLCECGCLLAPGEDCPACRLWAERNAIASSWTVAYYTPVAVERRAA